MITFYMRNYVLFCRTDVNANIHYYCLAHKQMPSVILALFKYTDTHRRLHPPTHTYTHIPESTPQAHTQREQLHQKTLVATPPLHCLTAGLNCPPKIEWPKDTAGLAIWFRSGGLKGPPERLVVVRTCLGRLPSVMYAYIDAYST